MIGLNLFQHYLEGFELKTFGNRAKTLLDESSYDIVIDNQSLSYGMIEVQKIYP